MTTDSGANPHGRKIRSENTTAATNAQPVPPSNHQDLLDRCCAATRRYRISKHAHAAKKAPPCAAGPKPSHAALRWGSDAINTSVSASSPPHATVDAATAAAVELRMSSCSVVASNRTGGSENTARAATWIGMPTFDRATANSASIASGHSRYVPAQYPQRILLL